MIVCSFNGRKYVGQTVLEPKKRWSAHKGHAVMGIKKTPLMSAMLAHGIANFEFHVLEENVPIEKLNMREKHYIDVLQTTDQAFGYNVQRGGRSAFGVSDETRRKLSNHFKGRKFSDETRNKISEANKRRHASKTPEERKASMDRMRAIRDSKPISKETKAKLRKKMLGNTIRRDFLNKSKQITNETQTYHLN